MTEIEKIVAQLEFFADKANLTPQEAFDVQSLAIRALTIRIERLERRVEETAKYITTTSIPATG